MDDENLNKSNDTTLKINNNKKYKNNKKTSEKISFEELCKITLAKLRIEYNMPESEYSMLSDSDDEYNKIKW